MTNEPKKIACLYHPLTTVFLDDSQVFLDAVTLEYGRKKNVLTYVSPKEAMQVIKNSGNNLVGNFLKVYHDVDIDDHNKKVIDLDIASIKDTIWAGISADWCF